MQLEEARDLRERWGEKLCNHPDLTKEYYLGTQTGDYVCTTCGKARWGRDWNKTKSE
ncbi:hypothetical protein [Lysinibacillus xylanilyticus]|uniref:hypothetical protein n=1 Tax=Lysinibacillus xylanilyticus TaxID=582475 RepID=UPI003CFE6130